MKYMMLSLLILGVSACSTAAKVESSDQKSAAGALKAETCMACHGVDGKTGKTGVPPLANRSYDELVAAMERVRDAYSPQPLLGHSLTDEDIQDIAAYFSSIK